MLSATLLVSPPADAAGALPTIALPSASERGPTFQEASVTFADSLIPVVRGLKAKPAAPLASKSVALAATGDANEIMKTIDAGLDAFLSVPPERFFAAVGSLKEGTALAAQSSECNLVCLPPAQQTQTVARVAADALSVTDTVKLKAFLLQGGTSLASGERSQYAGVLTEAVKFSFSLDRDEVVKAKVRLLGAAEAASLAALRTAPSTDPAAAPPFQPVRSHARP